MKRRSFNSLIFAGGALGVISCAVPAKVKMEEEYTSKPLIKPAKLKQGDTIGLVAPGSAFDDGAYQRTLESIKNLGLKYKNANNLFGKYGYVAGSDKDRIDDLHQMFSDKEIDAIWCVRGGYGSTRIMYDLDYDLIRNNPKIFVGYSDITVLLQSIHKVTGLVTFHGPVGASEMTPYTFQNFRETLFNDKKIFKIPSFETADTKDEFKPEIIVQGKMKGELVGGNLSLLAAMAGTSYELDTTDKLVFIEDVGEKPYSVDRMLTQLIQTSKLDKSAGILLGVFNDCDVDENEKGTLRLKETIKDRLGDLGVPVYYGFSFGHIKNMCTLPVGIKAKFDMGKKELTLLENGVI